MNDNKDLISHAVHLPNDPSINVLNYNSQYKNSMQKQKQEESRRKKENVKVIIKTILWFLGLIVLNVLLQVLGHYGNYDYSGFELNWQFCIWGSVLYCVFSLIISALLDRAKNPKWYKAIDQAKSEAQQKQIETLKKQVKQDEQTNKPQCPTCGSTNIRHISAAERGVNTVMFGFFGNKRKCQFECLNPNCGYRW